MADLIKAEELKNRLKKVPEWELEKKHIERTFEFDDFSEAIDFVTGVAEVGRQALLHEEAGGREENGHHDRDRLVHAPRGDGALETQSDGGRQDIVFQLGRDRVRKENSATRT